VIPRRDDGPLLRSHQRDRSRPLRPAPGSIGVLEALDHLMPIGMACQAGWTEGGMAVWPLTVNDTDVPRPWPEPSRA
jgi:hypothetical protein